MFDVIKTDGSHWKFDYIEFYDDFICCVNYEYFLGQVVGHSLCLEFDLEEVACIVNMHNSIFEETYEDQALELSNVMMNSNIARGVLWKIENIKA